MGLVSPVTLHVDRPDMLPMFMFMPAVADEPMRRETAKSRIGVDEVRRTRHEFRESNTGPAFSVRLRDKPGNSTYNQFMTRVCARGSARNEHVYSLLKLTLLNAFFHDSA